MQLASEYFRYARMRYQIFLDKEAGKPKPWTDDETLQRHRFCNIFREDDRVTKWVKENVRDRYAGHPRLLQAVAIARWFNRQTTLERLLELDLLVNWNTEAFLYHMHHVRPIVTGAYMVKTPKGMDKHVGISWAIDHFIKDSEHLQARIEPGVTTLEGFCEVVGSYRYLGPFLSYEIATDLRHTPLLCDAPDIMTWANPGPGAARGINMVVHKKLNVITWSEEGRETMLQVMRELLAMSQDPNNWPSEWPKWEMREVEHTLCEFDKWSRPLMSHAGGAPKQRYNGVS